ncbi:MAG: prepilin-type N-terminal cleavage/methylation domain-containing protein [Clostridiaceae bacterium]|nr:prepilin-type N-terminal cleavage/methylation domain-containing protein [Clostridiaceae bacterium]
MKKIKKKKGFTLIELIIVIAIIAIIAAFAIPNFLKVQNNAKIDSDLNTAKTIENVCNVLYTDGTLKPTADSTQYTVSSDSKDDGKKINDYLKSAPDLKANGSKGPIIVYMNKDGSIVKITDSTPKQIYPTPEDPYVKK